MNITRRSLLATALLAIAGLVAACGDKPADAPVKMRLATTTSTENSGLLKFLLEPWQAQTGIEVQVIPVGTGQALELGKRGDADLVLVHDRVREDAFVRDGHATERRDVMWNDFVLLGPAADPAEVKQAKDIRDALQRIEASGAAFVSRGDKSGTHAREQLLRKQAGLAVAEPSDRWFETGQGMGPSMTVASEKGAYILADRGTWLAFKDRLDLEVVREGDESLRNPYGILLLPAAGHDPKSMAAAKRLADWLTGPEGQKRIGEFQVEGEVLFHPATGS